jgi:hypothetical protein
MKEQASTLKKITRVQKSGLLELIYIAEKTRSAGRVGAWITMNDDETMTMINMKRSTAGPILPWSCAFAISVSHTWMISSSFISQLIQ